MDQVQPMESATHGVPHATSEEEILEGLKVELVPAPFLRRFMAYAVDLGIITTILYAAVFLLGAVFVAGGLGIKALLGDDSASIYIIVVLLASLLGLFGLFDGYFVFFEKRQGVTPGKRIFGLKVISLRGGNLTLGQCVLRELLRHIDCLLILPGLISVWVSSKRQRLGDMAAGTMVVYSKHEEHSYSHVYLDKETYDYYLELLRPLPCDTVYAKQFLEFSYPCFVLGKSVEARHAASWWEKCENRCQGRDEFAKIPQEGGLRFYAEFCNQSLLPK